MVIDLPQNFQMNAINRFTTQVVRRDGKPSSGEMTFNFGKLGFIDGSGYTVLSNTIGWLLSYGVKVQFINYNRPENHAIQYLDDCGFFEKYINRKIRSAASRRGTTLPCTHVEQEYGFTWVEHQLSPWLCRTLWVRPSQISSIKACVKEVINNIADHSTVDTGFVHAQHYPNAHNLKITMSDFGAGIPSTIRARYGAMSDFEAIEEAVKDGVTAKSRPNNMGAGLSYLVDTVIANRGSVHIQSLSGNLACLCDTRGRLKQQRGRATGVYPGTLIEIGLDTRLFVGDDDDERIDFEW
ncbi:hypothetical protein A6F68_00691 [Tsuneonella dongtanensis]|uniref:Histidine kinase-, DNA gyrase B-, and HSP90-like ATPase n=1 Tax=Tsuneonella dongtanensis TaxID=692370 RepID=A0A1B2AAM5_9SPHN|nr:hypothetical protein [Tsuneonella dongtanensis]ANY19220.1 hypothetical protein A6F68_00691 [Tsuneonella dongtanensis]